MVKDEPSSPVEVVGQVDGDEHPCGGGVDTHVVRGVVQELGPGVALDVVRVVVAPAQLDVDPVLLRGGAVHHVSVGAGGRFNSESGN